MRRTVLLFAAIIGLGAARAEAITVQEIIELAQTGLGDEVLLALIEVERKVFPVDPDTLKRLKDAGVSQRVIAAMIRSGRMPPPVPEPVAAAAVAPEPVPAPPPQVVVVDHHEPEIVREVPVPVPVYVTVPVHKRHGHHHRPAGHDTVVEAAPAPSIGLPHSRIGLSPAPPVRRSDPPYWQEWKQGASRWWGQRQ